MTQAKTASRPVMWLWLAVVLILLDVVSKQWISSHFWLGERLEVLPFFNLVLAHNSGAAFSFLDNAGGWQRWAFSALAVVVSVVLVVWISRLKSGQTLLAIALSTVLAGAIGNLIDRVTLGYVVDFIQVYWNDWYVPAFNVADSAVTIGAGLLILDAFLHPETDTAKP